VNTRKESGINKKSERISISWNEYNCKDSSLISCKIMPGSTIWMVIIKFILVAVRNEFLKK